MVRIRLQRFGKKGKPFYRIVAANAKAPRDGAFIEILGTYDPKTSDIRIKGDRVKYWLKKGAQPTDIVEKFLRREEIM